MECDENIVCILIGNKADQKIYRHRQSIDGSKLAQKYAFNQYIEIPDFNGDHLDPVLEEIMSYIIKCEIKRKSTSSRIVLSPDNLEGLFFTSNNAYNSDEKPKKSQCKC